MTGILIDENLPHLPSLPTALPILHASSLGVQPSDTIIWDHARIHDLVIVSKDADFSERINLALPPPRVVHLRVGNMRRRELLAWVARVWPTIETAARSHKLVNVYHDRFEAIS